MTKTSEEDKRRQQKDIVRKNAGLPVTDEGMKQREDMKKIVDVTKEQMETNEKYQKDLDSLNTSKTRLTIEEKKSKEKFESEKEKLERKNEQLRKQQSSYKEKHDSLQEDIKKLENTKKNNQKEYDETEDKIDATMKDISKLKRENNRLKNEEKTEKIEKRNGRRRTTGRRNSGDTDSLTSEDYEILQRELVVMQRKAIDTHRDVSRMESKVPPAK